MGQEDRFAPASASGRCRFDQRTVAGASGDDADAPKDPMGVRIATGALPE